jgi:hypothetical protein
MTICQVKTLDLLDPGFSDGHYLVSISKKMPDANKPAHKNSLQEVGINGLWIIVLIDQKTYWA